MVMRLSNRTRVVLVCCSVLRKYTKTGQQTFNMSGSEKSQLRPPPPSNKKKKKQRQKKVLLLGMVMVLINEFSGVEDQGGGMYTKQTACYIVSSSLAWVNWVNSVMHSP
jgi:hypothetical protein